MYGHADAFGNILELLRFIKDFWEALNGRSQNVEIRVRMECQLLPKEDVPEGQLKQFEACQGQI